MVWIFGKLIWIAFKMTWGITKVLFNLIFLPIILIALVIGGLVSFSALFGYNPVGWLCLFILIAGILGSARIVLGHHTLGEVLSGFAVGLICALLVLHPVSNILFRVFLF